MSDSFDIPWAVARWTALSMYFSRQEYWSRLPFPSPGYLPNQGIEPVSPELEGGLFTTELPGKLYWTMATLLNLFQLGYLRKDSIS